MPRFIAFLRAINAGPGHTVKMERLRQTFESVGLVNVATFIASGNVVFETPTTSVKRLERQIKNRLFEVLGYEVATFIRTEAELAEIAHYWPFREFESDASGEFNIAFLAEPLDPKLKQKVMELNTGTNRLHVHGREIYWQRRHIPGTTDFAPLPLEKTLGMPITVRGARTIQKLAAKYCSGGRGMMG